MSIVPKDSSYDNEVNLIKENKNLIDVLDVLDYQKTSVQGFMKALKALNPNYKLIIFLGDNYSGINIINLEDETAEEWTW